MAALPMATDHGDRACKKLAVAAYIRVSTSTQVEDGLGLQIQQEQIESYLKQNPGLTLVQTFRDEGFSGSSLDRPALRDVLALAREKRIGKLIVAKLDRLSRDLYVQLYLEKELLVHGVEVISLAESLSGTDPIMVAMRQIVGVFAQLERGRITERLLAGRKTKLRAGGYSGGAPPLGYRADGGRLVVDRAEEEIVRRIHRARMGRRSFGWIANELNKAGFKPRRGKRYYPSTVRHIALSKVYRGWLTYGDTVRGTHEPIRL